MKICVFTIGCKVNQYESDSLIYFLTERGFDVYDDMAFADVYIINTCAVTGEAERKSRQAVSRATRLNPKCKIYIIGCASEKNSEQFTNNNVVYVSGTGEKSRLRLFEELEGINVSPLPVVYEDNLKPKSLRTRSYVKVQDGCDNFCSYCILPYVRGRSRSRNIDSIVKEVKELSLVSPEIVLTGINLSQYGIDIGVSINDMILSIKGIAKRLRLGSLEANIINREFLELLKSLKEFCPHFHLSLQSGDDKILKDMNRHYSGEEYYGKIKLIREYFPYASITTDLIVGFPTEEEKEFNNTIEFVKKCSFANIHIFPYSRRDGSAASKYKCISGDIIKSRVRLLEEIRDTMRDKYNSQFIGKTLNVLIEEDNDGLYEGYSDNYIKIFTNEKVKMKEINSITPKKLYRDGLIG